MEPISTLLTIAAGYILKGAAQSKTAATAREQVLHTFWKWIRPRFIKEVPGIEETPDNPDTIAATEQHLLHLAEDEQFFRELQQQVATLREKGITSKNVVKGSISDVKNIRIGDRYYAVGEHYINKNVIEGDISNADTFTLGDGH